MFGTSEMKSPGFWIPADSIACSVKTLTDMERPGTIHRAFAP